MRWKALLFKHMKLAFMMPGLIGISFLLMASSHREAPMIANDPLADNTDLYAFRSPDNPNTITIIANYVPLQLPYGGPNYNNFGENIRYEIHIDNNLGTKGDEPRAVGKGPLFLRTRRGTQSAIGECSR